MFLRWTTIGKTSSVTCVTWLAAEMAHGCGVLAYDAAADDDDEDDDDGEGATTGTTKHVD